MNSAIIASQILAGVGGKENIRSATHCMTRLRLYLVDEALANDQKIEEIEGVLKVIRQGGQFQIVIGNEVQKVYQQLLALGVSTEKKQGAETEKKTTQNPISRFFGFIAGCMTPLLPAMLGGGMVKVLVTLLVSLGILNTQSSTYTILYLTGDAFFYFLPIMLASSVAKRIGSNQMLAMLLAALLLHPDLTTLLEQGNPTLLGIPVHSANYASSVLPIFLIVPFMKYVEILAEKVSPRLLKVFLKPLLVLLISAPVSLLLLGPIGSIAGEWLATGVSFLYNRAGWLTILLLSAAMPFIIMTGMHYALVPIASISLTTIGFDPILTPTMFCSNLAQGSASLAVSLKSKDKNLKQISLGAGISALVAGVTEPALYGVTLKLRTPLRAACIAAAVGGLYAGLTGVVAYTLGGSPSAISLVTMIGGNGYTTLVNGVITLVIVFLLSFLLTLLFFKDQPSHTVKTAPENQISQVQEFAGQSVSSDNTQAAEAENGSGKEETIFSPLCGQVVPLSSLSDVTFSSGVLGKGCAIVPYKGRVLAPFKGRVENIVNTKHALALCSDLGTELLIHIGQDTVALDGKYFTSYCQTGDRFQVGDLLLEFDLESIQKEGYDLTTPIVIVNREDQKIGVLCDQKIQVGDPLLCLLSSSVPNETKAINTKETDKP